MEKTAIESYFFSTQSTRDSITFGDRMALVSLKMSSKQNRRFYLDRTKPHSYLTFRELELAIWLSDFSRNSYGSYAKARKLFKRTIETYAQQLFRKLGVISKRSAIQWLHERPCIVMRMKHFIRRFNAPDNQ